MRGYDQRVEERKETALDLCLEEAVVQGLSLGDYGNLTNFYRVTSSRLKATSRTTKSENNKALMFP